MVSSRYSEVKEASRGMNINFPDIHRMYEKFWAESLKENGDARLVILESMEKFTLLLEDAIENAKSKNIYGIKLFR